MKSHYPRSAIATALSVSIGLEGVAISAENPCWPQSQVESLCVRPATVLLHTEFPEAPLLLSGGSAIAVIASTRSTQVSTYAGLLARPI
jgi:hypothetical protein